MSDKKFEDEEKPGCLMARLNAADAARFYMEVNKLIPESEVDVESGGYERDTHVTVLFGFQYGFKTAQLKKFLKEQNPFHLTLGPIGSFKKKDGSGVLKVDVVDSPALHELHHALRKEFKHKVDVTFPDYKPHLTLAYLKAGAKAFDLEGSTKFAGETYRFSELVFSYGTSAHRSCEMMKLGNVSEAVLQLLHGRAAQA